MEISLKGKEAKKSIEVTSDQNTIKTYVTDLGVLQTGHPNPTTPNIEGYQGTADIQMDYVDKALVPSEIRDSLGVTDNRTSFLVRISNKKYQFDHQGNLLSQSK